MGGISFPYMSTTALESTLAFYSRDTGIPKRELRRMCMQAGLEQLSRGELKVSAKNAGNKPKRRRTA
jgi:hypothetical protein